MEITVSYVTDQWREQEGFIQVRLCFNNTLGESRDRDADVCGPNVGIRTEGLKVRCWAGAKATNVHVRQVVPLYECATSQRVPFRSLQQQRNFHHVAY